MESAQEEEIVIVGGGICGLATALAFHRKGIRSIVLEKSETLRTTGVGIIIQSNGWRALDQLGVASMLRNTAIHIQSGNHISVGDNKPKELPNGGELRCLRRTDLVKALANDLPWDTIQFGKQVVSIEEDPITSYPILHLQDGSVVKAKIVIGCDGVNSIIATILGLNSTKLSPTCVVRGFSYFQNGHDYGSKYHLLSNVNDRVKLGIVPVTHKLIYWFVTRKWNSQDLKISRDRMLIKESTVELLKNFPQETVELIRNSDLESLHLTDLRYRSPWDVLKTNFRKGTVTVAGDAMHAMGPFLAQAGSASLEDAVVLARCLGEKIQNKPMKGTRVKEMVEEGLDQYLKKRKMRVFWLCLQTYLTGTVIQPSSLPMKFLSIFLLIILFRDPNQHTRYDCGNS
ncbi:hypothetical protein GH714_029419 [Hevea brasiliensis]|uniref:FAD-binding domain-containing protein n=1 Tax=Hevea brasiliensis TaxID=3981 RepID=A0A6A6K7I0_HEVBR|nr:hypothetical protein GH714_029419 [Hevea brasiliensis]